MSSVFPNEIIGSLMNLKSKGGLSKRELIAAMSLQGLLASNEESLNWSQAATATLAVRFADALLTELGKKEKP